MARSQIEFPSIPHAQMLFGQHNANLRFLEDTLGVEINAAGNSVSIGGSKTAVASAEKALVALYERAKENREITAGEFQECLRAEQGSGEPGSESPTGSVALFASNGKTVTARTPNQKIYVQAVRHNDLVFGIGPAGTGKTYLAMALAVDALMRKQVRRIVLVRPAVEAGEKLGFLPGDMAEKVNPYLRPLYDALYDMVDMDRAQRWMSQGAIEVAPLAFMRGRTLNSAFVILDEAQNTTPEQMKMFLTRLGADAKMVVTGDLTQTDLEKGTVSGLAHAIDILNGVEGIEIVRLTKADIVRHPLVQRIVRAYENAEPKHDDTTNNI